VSDLKEELHGKLQVLAIHSGNAALGLAPAGV
jgi:hypothetical protein